MVFFSWFWCWFSCPEQPHGVCQVCHCCLEVPVIWFPVHSLDESSAHYFLFIWLVWERKSYDSSQPIFLFLPLLSLPPPPPSLPPPSLSLLCVCIHASARVYLCVVYVCGHRHMHICAHLLGPQIQYWVTVSLTLYLMFWDCCLSLSLKLTDRLRILTG